MRTRPTLAAAALFGAGALVGWLAGSGRLRLETPPPAVAAQTPPAKEPARGDPPVNGAAKPNIVFVLMDNLGYGEVGCYGGGVLRGAPTPRIDKLAAEGTRLLNFNV